METNSKLWLVCFGEDWVYNEGWYYYKGIVEPDTWGGEENPLMLIDHVCLDGEDTGNEYQGATLTINVEAEAVQASNNAYQSVWGDDQFTLGERGG